jgi:hypothetical protein
MRVLVIVPVTGQSEWRVWYYPYHLTRSQTVPPTPPGWNSLVRLYRPRAEVSLGRSRPLSSR